MLVLGCESEEPIAPRIDGPLTSIGVAEPGPGPVTNFSGKPQVSWLSPALDANARSIPDEEMRGIALQLASLVEWPSGKVVPGQWTKAPESLGTNRIVFEREGEPSGSWEAVVLDGSKMPKEFGGADHVGPPIVYSPVSRPVVVFVNAALIMESSLGETSGDPRRTEGNDLLGLIFSEPITFGDQPFAKQQQLADWVQVDSKQSGHLDCKPSWNLELFPGPSSDRWVLECPPFNDNDEITIRIKSSIKSAAGASLADSYSLSEDEDVTIQVTIPGPDPKEPATPREAGKNSLLEQANVPKFEEKTP